MTEQTRQFLAILGWTSVTVGLVLGILAFAIGMHFKSKDND